MKLGSRKQKKKDNYSLDHYFEKWNQLENVSQLQILSLFFSDQ